MRRACAASLLALAFAPGAAPATEFEARGIPVGENGGISRANLDPREAWPLTIERGTFVCEGEAVFLSDGKTQYPLNGVAKTLATTHPEHRRPLEDIWRPDEESMRGMQRGPVKVDMVRVNISPVLSRGVAWCRKR